MRFAFLGYSGAVQLKGSDNASLLLERGGEGLLVDVGGGACGKLRELGFDPQNLAAVLITHGHIDHIYGLPSLLHQMWLLGRTKPLTILGLPAALDTAERLVELFALPEKKGMFPLEFREVAPGEVYSWRDLSLRWVAMEHSVPTVGFQVLQNSQGQLFYSADTSYCPELGPVLGPTRVVIHEAATLEEVGEATRSKGHSTAADAGRCARDLAAETLYLFHFDQVYESRLAEFVREAASTFHGQLVELSERKAHGSLIQCKGCKTKSLFREEP
ncbi:MBL fold metallo-hydrolase [Candidatus Darwinibacter acetoxidans]